MCENKLNSKPFQVLEGKLKILTLPYQAPESQTMLTNED